MILRLPIRWRDVDVLGHVNNAVYVTYIEHALVEELGLPASVMTEYAEYGIGLSPANNDRQAGYLRLCELLRLDPRRIRPSWAPPTPGVVGAPRLYMFRTCKHLIEQFKSAPVAAEGLDAGEVVDPKWATAHGHSIDAARYGAMSRPSPSEESEPDQVLDDPRAEALRQHT